MVFHPPLLNKETKLVVLVNKYTASAAEIVAGAIQVLSLLALLVQKDGALVLLPPHACAIFLLYACWIVAGAIQVLSLLALLVQKYRY